MFVGTGYRTSADDPLNYGTIIVINMTDAERWPVRNHCDV